MLTNCTSQSNYYDAENRFEEQRRNFCALYLSNFVRILLKKRRRGTLHSHRSSNLLRTQERLEKEKARKKGTFISRLENMEPCFTPRLFIENNRSVASGAILKEQRRMDAAKNEDLKDDEEQA